MNTKIETASQGLSFGEPRYHDVPDHIAVEYTHGTVLPESLDIMLFLIT
jgi:hypothetical protein